MKLTKALKLKNQLAGEVSELEAEISALQDGLDEFNHQTSVVAPA